MKWNEMPWEMNEWTNEQSVWSTFLVGWLAHGDGNDNDDDSEGDSSDDDDEVLAIAVVVVVDDADNSYVWLLWHMLKAKCINILILHRKLAARTLHPRYAYS